METVEMEVDEPSPVAASVDQYFDGENNVNAGVRMHALDSRVDGSTRMEYGGTNPHQLKKKNTPIEIRSTTSGMNPPPMLSSASYSRRPPYAAIPSPALQSSHPESSLSSASLSHSSLKNPSDSLTIDNAEIDGPEKAQEDEYYGAVDN
ncbi:hypothetical protein PMAYCL1PPCAC_20807, partial [Pristionchus mayeri]